MERTVSPGDEVDNMLEQLRVGKYLITKIYDGDFWIEHDSGEGMQVFRLNFERLPDSGLAVDAVETALVAVLAERYRNPPHPLDDLMCVARAGCPADYAPHRLDALHVFTLARGHRALVLTLHVMTLSC